MDEGDEGDDRCSRQRRRTESGELSTIVQAITRRQINGFLFAEHLYFRPEEIDKHVPLTKYCRLVMTDTISQHFLEERFHTVQPCGKTSQPAHRTKSETHTLPYLLFATDKEAILSFVGIKDFENGSLK